MTMDDEPGDEVMTSLAALRTHDVSGRYARRLRDRCHGLLRQAPRATPLAGVSMSAAVLRAVVPALGGAWCLLYLTEIVRLAAAIYGGSR